jgi:hypothetical protein
MEATILFVAIAALILLAVTSLRFGVDSRESFRSAEHELARRGLVWEGSLAPQDRVSRDDHRRRQDECLPTACA